MIEIIQIYGPPCSGKSTWIKEFVKNNNHWSFFDIAHYRESTEDFLSAENMMLKKILSLGKKNLIIESAHGFHDLNSINIKFKPDIEVLKTNHIKRKLELSDERIDYYSLLETIEINPDIIININKNTTYETILYCINKIRRELIYGEKDF